MGRFMPPALYRVGGTTWENGLMDMGAHTLGSQIWTPWGQRSLSESLSEVLA